MRQSWTEAEDEVLREFYPREGAAVAERLGRSKTSVYGRVHALGLKTEGGKHPSKVVSPVITRDGVDGKACVKCLEWRPLKKFSRQKTCAGGRRNICTTCEGRRAYANSREAVIRAVRRYQERHREETRELKRASNRRRHGQKVLGPGVTAAQWRAIRKAFDGKCAYCGAHADTMDHVIPLSRGGLHAPENVVPACKDCNFRKKCKTPGEWKPAKGR